MFRSVTLGDVLLQESGLVTALRVYFIQYGIALCPNGQKVIGTARTKPI
jgi:hypothetical protein